MSLIYTPDLFDKLQDANLLLDTCTIIDASKCAEMNDFLEDLSKNSCTFLSLPAVRDEFVCSAKNSEEYRQLEEYIESLDILFLSNVEKRISSVADKKLSIALSRCKSISPSYVDRLLLKVPYVYRNSSEKIYLITSNYKDVPQELFNRIGFITYDAGSFNNVGVYEFDGSRFEHMVRDLT